MNMKAAGIWKCNVIEGKGGGNPTTGVIEASITVEITEGPNKGERATYSETIDMRSAKYARQTMMAVGWSGKTILSLADDIKAFIAKTGGGTTVEIKRIDVKNGKRAGQIWDKVNSIGRQQAKPLTDLTADNAMLRDADAALAAAIDAGDFGGFGEREPANGAPAPTDDIPF